MNAKEAQAAVSAARGQAVAVREADITDDALVMVGPEADGSAVKGSNVCVAVTFYEGSDVAHVAVMSAAGSFTFRASVKGGKAVGLGRTLKAVRTMVYNYCRK
jgi:hypothetical protein